VNLEHLRTFLWLRWRLQANQVRRGGTLATVLVTLLVGAAGVAAALLLVGSFLVGLLVLADVPAVYHLYIWDGLTAMFLFGWTVGLMTELQRTESLSLDKFLHLPVSLSGAFLINYVSSFMSLSMLLFVPASLGLILGEAISIGPAVLLALPLLAAFLFAVTALTYQFQGWLGSLMTNPRRRRTVIVFVTLTFILIVQLPNLFNLIRTRDSFVPAKPAPAASEEQKALTREFLDRKLTQKEFNRRTEELTRRQRDEAAEAARQRKEEQRETVRFVNVVLPPAWFPLGVADLAAGRVLPALGATLLFAAVGSLSLWRAYRATVRLYTGHTRETVRPVSAPAKQTGPPTRPRLVEWRIPGLPEGTAAVATAGFRSLVRAPEAKMMLLTPLLFVFVFGSVVLSGTVAPPDPLRPVIAFGGGLLVLLMGLQLLGNQFGYDRGGFRAFVLSPVPRHEVLLGKNLSAAPLILALAVLAMILVEVFYPMRFDRFLAAVAQFGSAGLLFALVANMLSIFAPIPIAAGSFKPAQTRLVPVLLHMLALVVLPTVLAPTFLPLGIELLLELAGVQGLPVALVLSLGLLVLVGWLYLRALRWQGGLFAAREKQILEVVTSKSE
jgi:hypothetical protein